MRYYKVITWTTGEEFQTRESYIDEPTFRKYQKALSEGADFIILKEKVIRSKMIKEIIPCDDEIQKHLEAGIPLLTLGLPANPQIE